MKINIKAYKSLQGIKMTILFIPAFPMLLTYTLGNKGTICFTFSMLLSFTWEGAFGVLFAPVVLTVQLCTLRSHF